MDQTIKAQLRQVQIEILDEVVRICQAHNLRYCLSGGTCLGAARHKGFIPWDDDIDIFVPRPDFDSFVNLTKEDKDGAFFLDYYITNSTYGRCFAKYCKRNTLFIEPNGLRQAIYIDIFPHDKVPGPDYFTSSFIPTFIHKLDAITVIRREGLEGRDFKTRLIYYATRFVPIRWIFRWETKLMTRFENTNSGYYVNYGSRYSLLKENIAICEVEPYSQLEFEGKYYNVPKNWDLYLTRVYGDYMTLPPVEKRVSHFPQLVCFDTTQGQ